MVPFGYTVEMWKDAGFTGEYQRYSGPVYTSAAEELQCIEMEHINSVGSIAVYRNAYVGSATGRWIGSTSTETLTFTYHIGFQYSSSTADHVEEQMALSYEMEVGMEFGGVGESETISEEYTVAIAQDTESAYSYDISVDLLLTCTGTEGVGLWQYVTESRDGKSRVLTTHTVCRYGANYNSSPACPWMACLDLECTQCKGDWSSSS